MLVTAQACFNQLLHDLLHDMTDELQLANNLMPICPLQHGQKMAAL